MTAPVRSALPRPRLPARVVSVRSWLAAPRGNSLSFRPLRLSTPVTAASSSARSRERLHEPGPGPEAAPEFGPQLTAGRFPPEAAGPEYSAAAATATKPAAAISQPKLLQRGSPLPTPGARLRACASGWLGGRGMGLPDPDGRLTGSSAAAPPHSRRLAPPTARFPWELQGTPKPAAALRAKLPGTS